MKFSKGWLRATGIALGLLPIGAALAAGGAGFQFLGGDVSYNGLFRVETALSTSGHASEVNQFGDQANNVAIRRAPGNPALGYAVPLQPTDSLIGPGGVVPLSGFGVLPPTRGVSQQVGINDTITRYVPAEHPILNYHILRFEATPSISWGAWSIQTRIRAVYDPGNLGYADFNYDDYKDINNGISGGVPRQFHHKPDYLGYQVDGNTHPLIFEQSGRHYQIDLPAFFLQWTNGQLTARVGNQSVAWGQLLFFRVMDVANGLDLRRHLILNRAIEEYADSRESAPGIRLTYQLTDQIIADAYAQQFIPTILNNVNTSYNVVPSQFTIEDRYSQDGNNHDVNYGLRLKGEFGSFNFQAMYTRRYNPLGAIRWTESGVNKPLPNSNILGLAFNQYCSGILAAQGKQSNNGCGPLLAQTPFEVAPAGVFSAEEWFNYAGYIKLSGLDGLNAAINDFPAAQELLAQPVGRNPDAAAGELSAFFSAGEGLRGHIERKYFQENIFGAGGGIVTEAEPGSIFDQAIINLEATYTPKRTFTAISLGKDFDRRDEEQIGLVVEKYQRFSTDFPATYMVFQYLWQRNSDLVGLLLDGYGSQNYSNQGIRLNKEVPTNDHPKINPGIWGGANYIVLAALQPTPNYIFEYSVAALIDVQGGLLIQPAVQWKPRGNMTVNLFYNFTDDNAWGNNPNKNVVRFLNNDDEVSIRLGYQF